MSPAGTSILVGIAASPGIAIGRCWSQGRLLAWLADSC